MTSLQDHSAAEPSPKTGYFSTQSAMKMLVSFGWAL